MRHIKLEQEIFKCKIMPGVFHNVRPFNRASLPSPRLTVAIPGCHPKYRDRMIWPFSDPKVLKLGVCYWGLQFKIQAVDFNG